MKYLLKFNEQQINEGEINWEKEKSWKIKDEFPITVFVEKSWPLFFRVSTCSKTISSILSVS